MDEECNDPLCKVCGNTLDADELINEVNISADPICLSCETAIVLGQPISDICLLSALNIMGIGYENPPPGNIHKFTAPNGICIDSRRLSNALESVNAQLPTGSFQGYLSDIFSTASTTVSTAAKNALYVIMASVIVFGFVLFAIICMIFIANNVIGAGLGIGMLFVGLFVGAMTLVIVLAEISSLSTQLQNDLFVQVGPIVNTIKCALTAGLCCYPGSGCCCGKPAVCKNVPGPPCTEMPE